MVQRQGWRNGGLKGFQPTPCPNNGQSYKMHSEGIIHLHHIWLNPKKESQTVRHHIPEDLLLG